MRQRVVGVVAGAAVALAGGTLIVAAARADGSEPPAARFAQPAPAVLDANAAPVEAAAPAPRTAAPVKARSRAVPIAPAGRHARTAEVPRRDTERFSMVSVTWTDPGDAPAGAVQVRTRSAASGRWSGWQALETEESNGPDRAAEAAGVRGGTGAIWVGESDGVQARLADGGAPLPAGLRLNLIDPGRMPAGTGGQGGMAVDFPAYTARSAWGADESLTSGTPSYAESVQVQFVHHTAGGNTYSCADSPAILRGILVDHTRNRGWDDIGYNFLVDRCGTLFEGRRGGVDRPVIGAHTYGFNTLSAGIAVLGDYRTTAVPAAVTATLARVAAAKLGRYGLDPAGTTQLTEGVSDGKFPLGTVVTFPRVSGHRDGVHTECPGDALYAQLPAVRTAAAGGVLGLTARPVTGGAANGSSYYVRTSATLSWSVTAASADIAGFDLLVDGRVAGTVPGDVRSAPVTLAAGTRKLQVRARHIGGATATTAAQTVVAKTQPPAFPAAATLSLRSGAQVSATAVPVSLAWQAKDAVRLSSVTLTSPWAKTFTSTTVAYGTTAPVGRSSTWSLTARDLVGNTATSTVARTPALLAETSAARSGKWSTRAGATAYLGGSALATSAKGAKLTATVTGRGIGLIVTRTPTSGKAAVYVNGTKVATIDLRASSTTYRQLIYARKVSSAPTRITVQIVNLGTSGRPGITVDGFAYLK